MSTAIDTATRQEVTGYDPTVSFYASRYMQGARVVYALDLSLTQIAGLLPAPDPKSPQPGNRRITPAHALGFGNYVRGHRAWVAPGISLRSTDEFEFDVIREVEGAQFGVVTIPFLALTHIHILDGQHRILGIHVALRAITTELEKTKGQLSRLEKRRQSDDQAEEEARLEQMVELKAKIQSLNIQRFRFEHERMSVQVYIEDEQSAYQQMFFDISDNALNITASVRARFDTRKPINRVLQDVLQHPLLEGRVDLESDRLGRQNHNLLSAKHVAEILRLQAVGIDGRMGRRVEMGIDETALLQQANQFFTLLSDTFTDIGSVASGEADPAELRTHSMVASPVMIRVLASVYRELKRRNISNLRIKRFFQALDPYLSKPATKEWVQRVGGELFFPGALSPSSRRQDLVELSQIMAGWGENQPDWLKENK